MSIINIYFREPGVHVGGGLISYWSAKSGETDQICKAITVEDRKADGVTLHYRAGAMMHDIDVPRSEIRQITRDASVQVVKAEGKK